MTTPTPNGGKPLVQIVIGLDTLTGTGDLPAELVGYGPIPADLARAAATDAVWKRLVTDPTSGALLDHGRTTYRPPAALRDYLTARDLTCRFPTCIRRALDCHLDHLQPWAHGGPTDAANLHDLCPTHHTLKEQPGWQVHAHPDGAVTWTTPTGHRYTSPAPDYRDHLPDNPEPEPPPPQQTNPTKPASLPEQPPF